jgi:hypothetical protein
MKSNTNRTMVLRLRRFTQKDSRAVLTVVRTATVFLKRGSASTFVSIGRIRPDVSDFTTKRKRQDPDEYDWEGKRPKKERDLFNRQVRRSVKAFSEPGTWGTGTAYS